MISPKLLTAVASVAFVTSALSLGTPSPIARAAGQRIEVQADPQTAVPAIAAVGAAGFAVAFALGALEGYLHATNERREAQQNGTLRPKFARLREGGLDHVLD